MVSGDIYASYRIDGLPLDDIDHRTRARSTPRITVLNAAYGFGVRRSPIAVERAALAEFTDWSG